MKKITSEQEALLTKGSFEPRKSKFSALFEELATLEVGNGRLFVSKKELLEKGYGKHTTLQTLVKNRDWSAKSLLFGRKFQVTSYQEGWVVYRVV